MLLQKLKYSVEDDLQLAERYYSIVSILNDFDLAKREIQLLSFTAVNGDIGKDEVKEKYVEHYGSSLATIGNIISKLTNHEMKLLVKNGKEVHINKGLNIDFKKDLMLAITLVHEK